MVAALASKAETELDAAKIKSNDLAYLLSSCFAGEHGNLRTQILKMPRQGNCQTAVIVPLKPMVTPALPVVLDLCNKMRKVTKDDECMAS